MSPLSLRSKTIKNIVLGTQWFLTEIDGNYRIIDENCREIDLIQGSHPPWGKKKIRREKCTKKLVYSSIDISCWITIMYL